MRWSQPFLEYYMKEIHPDVTTCIARWLLEPLRVYNHYSGITTNQSEGFNTVLKRLQQWKEAPVDSILLSLYQLQTFYYNEIQRGLCQSGNYSLCPQFSNLAQPPESVQLLDCILPEDIVARVRSLQSRDPQEEVDPQEVASGIQTLKKSSACRSADSSTSQLARAKLVIAENRITHDLKLGAFVVQNSEGKHNVVTLFPKQSCTCPSTNECYHILAAKLSIRLACKHEMTTINLSQLIRNARSRKEKKSGRKKPRPEDCTINPAPDSLYGTDPSEYCVDTEYLNSTAQGDQVQEKISEAELIYSGEACDALEIAEGEQ